nr:hypothetical protein B7L52_21500 [Pectobacterium carotovorum]
MAETRIRYGVQHIHGLLRREGWLISHKKTRRIYCQEGLNLRKNAPSTCHRQTQTCTSGGVLLPVLDHGLRG